MGATARKVAWNSNRPRSFPKANLNVYSAGPATNREKLSVRRLRLEGHDPPACLRWSGVVRITAITDLTTGMVERPWIPARPENPTPTGARHQRTGLVRRTYASHPICPGDLAPAITRSASRGAGISCVDPCEPRRVVRCRAREPPPRDCACKATASSVDQRGTVDLRGMHK